MFPNTYVPRFMILVPMLPSNVSQSRCSPNLYYPVPVFPSTHVSHIPVPMLPSPYVPQSLCSPVHLFPSPYRCSPVPMHPSLYVPPTISQVPMFPSPIPQKCFPFLMFPRHVPQCLLVFPSAYVPHKCFHSLYSPKIFPSPYVHQSLCSPVLMFP